jgi:hypothetical protein
VRLETCVVADGVMRCGRPVAVLMPAHQRPRGFGQLSALAVADTFDDPPPHADIATWEGNSYFAGPPHIDRHSYWGSVAALSVTAIRCATMYFPQLVTRHIRFRRIARVVRLTALDASRSTVLCARGSGLCGRGSGSR